MSTFVSFLDLREPEMAVRSLAFKIFFVLVFDVLFISIIVAITLVVLWVMILVRKHRAILGEHTLEATPSGLVEIRSFASEDAARVFQHEIETQRMVA